MNTDQRGLGEDLVDSVLDRQGTRVGVEPRRRVIASGCGVQQGSKEEEDDGQYSQRAESDIRRRATPRAGRCPEENIIPRGLPAHLVLNSYW